MIKFIKGDFENIYVALLLFGSFVIVMPPTILNIPFYFFSVPLRYVLLLSAFYLIWNGIIKRVKINKVFSLAFLFFWIFYFVRVVYDLEILGVYNVVYESNMAYYQAMLYCSVVSYSCFYLKKIDYVKTLDYCYIFLLLGSVISLYIIQSAPSDLVQRAEGRLEGAEGLSSIDYGHYGVSLSILSIVLMFRKNTFLKKGLFFIGLILGLVVMFLSGSRSPFIALVLCVILFFSLNKGFLNGIIYLMLLLLPILFFYDQIMSYLDQFGSDFILRLVALIEGDRSLRDSIFSIGLEQFLNSPIFGSSFLINDTSIGGSYPHNLLLESFMSTGFLGGLCFLFLLIISLWRSSVHIRFNSEVLWVSILFIQQFVLSMASLAIYTHLKYWILMIILLSYNSRVNREKY